MRNKLTEFCLITLLGLYAATSAAEDRMSAPIAKKQPHTMTTHGDVRVDNYYWLRDDQRESPEIIEYLTQENDYTKQQLEKGESLKKEIYDELFSRMKQDDESVPYNYNGYTYRSRVVAGKNYSIYERRPVNSQGEWVVLVDGNERAEGTEYYRMGALAISPDNTTLAIAEDRQGRNEFAVSFRKIDESEWQENALTNTSGNIVWANDNQTLFYVNKDKQTLLPYQVVRHQYGTQQTQDKLVYEEKDDTFYVSLAKSTSKDFILIGITSTETSEYRLIDANQPQNDAKILKPRQVGVEYYPDHFNGKFYIRSNHQHPLFGLYIADNILAPWVSFIAPRDGVDLEGFALFNNWLVVEERQNGLVNIRQISWLTHKENQVSFDDPTYMAWIGNNPEPDTDTLRYGYSSMTTPSSVYEINMLTQEKQLLKQEEVKDFNKQNYQSERIWVTAQDGVKVPVSLVYRKDLFKHGQNPLLVYGYGAYGYGIDPSFSSSRLSLLDRGFVYAIAHIRGGGDLGKNWYIQGKTIHKMNTFTDFIDATKGLLSEGYGKAGHVYAMGGSAGGLLMGAVVNMAPDLYEGVVSAVPFVDVVTTMLDPSIPLTTGEYDEWGNPENEEDYWRIKAYSPYDNIKAQHYPHILVTTGLHDSQVQYWEPAKWVAKLRDIKQGNSLLLLETNMNAGHGGKSGRFNALDDIAQEYSFILMLENKDKYFPYLK
ncbi:S9 family peptidase [Providencia rettgeri]|uniref:S9 family peptidase n=1 Tax=Providencia rettgeri TaxID=587 RepID=A0AAE2ZI36_PRORE|nr:MULTISPECIES: S9 family peptidase [Providencia]MBW3118446.1 S9 family peptidase [Providencia rettgeri]MCK9789981.1 S9 family peptidase [Providencia rettgeri]MDX7422739.1 S9 family peptidase [Providencia sp. CIM-Carb-044]NHN51653.1 S9 family peptidase [Providencia rettgeri]QKG44919.1 S9 family peptidase [Providencia rettgeri]